LTPSILHNSTAYDGHPGLQVDRSGRRLAFYTPYRWLVYASDTSIDWFLYEYCTYGYRVTRD